MQCCVQKTEYMWNSKANVCVPPLSTVLLGQHNSDMIVFTFVAFFHVRTQPHVVRTGTRVLGGMGRDVRCRKTQILTASIWLGAELTGVWSYSKTQEKTSYFFFPLSKEPLSLLRRLVSTLYLDQLPSLIIFTVWSKTLRTAIKTEERLANKKLTASHSSSCFCHNVLIHKPVVQILHNKDDI